MKRTIIGVGLLIFLNTAISQPAAAPCDKWHSWFKPVCIRMHQIWTEGSNELYLTGYAWHNRYTYPKYKIASYNELATGGGGGKSFYDETGDWHGLYAFAFHDSHNYIEPVVGYAFLKVAHLGINTRLGAGYTVLITQRPDIAHGIPIPGVLPWISANYLHLTLAATYIPGSGREGNVLFVLGKWVFD